MTVKMNRVVCALALPSVLVTSLMLMRGSLSRMVPMPWPSAMSRVGRGAEVDDEGLGRFRRAGRRVPRP